MHFSSKRLLRSLCCSLPQNDLRVTALYHSHEAGTLVMLHTHQTKACELHSTTHVPTLCRTFSISTNLRVRCREPLVCAGYIDIRLNLHYNEGRSSMGTSRTSFLTLTSSRLGTLKIIRPACALMPLPVGLVNNPSAQARQVYFPIHKPAYAQYAVILPSPSPSNLVRTLLFTTSQQHSRTEHATPTT